MAAPVRFGTDGIRGRAGAEITPSLAYRLGRAVAGVVDVPVYVGFDTRESSPGLAAAVIAGVADAGGTPVNLGYFTTPGVAVIAQLRGGAGVVVSASHNPYYDNGLKVLAVGGGKLDRATEAALEERLNGEAEPTAAEWSLPEVDPTAEADYVANLRHLAPVDLSSLSIVIDCANGAASHVAEALFRATGATLTVLHAAPDGHNINVDSGSTDVAALARAVTLLGADLGLAFDGDADRMIAVDDEGRVRDGDDVMVLLALDWRAAGRCPGLVVTTMSNLGLLRALGDADIDVVVTDVGDRNVLVALEERDWCLGGEQSGHVILRDLAPTGDGLLTGLVLAELVARKGRLSQLADAAWRRVPQRLLNLPRADYDEAAVYALFDDLKQTHLVADDDVRLVVRPSGTEPVVRVMIEALDGDFVDEFAGRLAPPAES